MQHVMCYSCHNKHNSQFPRTIYAHWPAGGGSGQLVACDVTIARAVRFPSVPHATLNGKVTSFCKIGYFRDSAYALKSVQTLSEISLQIVSNLHLKVVDFTFLAETVGTYTFLPTQNDSNRRRHYPTLE